MLAPSLEDFPCYKLLAGFTLHPELKLVVSLTVGRAILGDVFSTQHFLAGFTLEAAKVPMASKGQESLAVLYVSAAASAILGIADVGRSRRCGFIAALAEAVLPIERDAVPSRKGFSANGADKASWVVGLPQDRNHLSLHKLPAVVAERAVKSLEVQRAEVVPVSHEEATLTQVTTAHLAGKALDVKVAALHPQHLSFTRFPTPEALDDLLR